MLKFEQVQPANILTNRFVTFKICDYPRVQILLKIVEVHFLN